MKKKLFILALIFSVFFIGCAFNQGDDTQSITNATITFERSGMYTTVEYAVQKVTIDNYGLLHETYYPNGTLSNSVYTKFEGNEYGEFINTLEENNFFALDEEYNSDILVADVGFGIITVNTSTMTKSVLIDPYINDGNPNNIVDIMEELQNLIDNANSPYQLNQRLVYQGVQCVQEPWEEWYSQGEVNFIKAPTDEELILAYYSSQNVEILELEKNTSDLATCQACEICQKSTYYEALVDYDDIEFMKQEGWELKEN